MELLIRNIEYKIIILLPFFAYFIPRFLYIGSSLSILISLVILLSPKNKIELNIISFLLISGLILCLLISMQNLLFLKAILFSKKALITQAGFIVQFIVVILLVNNSNKQNFITKIYTNIRKFIIPLSLITFYFNFSALSLDYQGSTSYPSLIFFYYSLYDKSLRGITRILLCFLNFTTIIISSKRATILSLLITLIIYLFSKRKKFIEIIKNLFLKLNIKKQFVYFSIFLLILFTLLYSNRIQIFSELRKLETTIDIILRNSDLSDQLQLIVITGGRIGEIENLLKSLNLNFIDLLSKVFTTGIGIGWQNNRTGATTLHNSFVLIALLGGLPWVIICIKIITRSLINSLKDNYKVWENNYFSRECISIISLSLGIDAFFSSNFAASFLSLLLFAAPLSFKIKKIT